MNAKPFITCCFWCTDIHFGILTYVAPIWSSVLRQPKPILNRKEWRKTGERTKERTTERKRVRKCVFQVKGGSLQHYATISGVNKISVLNNSKNHSSRKVEIKICLGIIPTTRMGKKEQCKLLLFMELIRTSTCDITVSTTIIQVVCWFKSNHIANQHFKIDITEIYRVSPQAKFY